jgi:hypothetical protein
MAGFIRKVLRVPTESEVGRGVEGKIEAARHFGEQLLFWEEHASPRPHRRILNSGYMYALD